MQVFAILFLVAVPVLNWHGVHWILGTLYAVSIGELDIADPAVALQTILLTKEVYVPLLLAMIIPIIVALIFGRVFCSWVCPHNTFSEWIEGLQRRLFKNRWRQVHARTVPSNPHPALTWGILAALIVTALVLGLPLLSYLSTPGIISSELSQAILGMGVGLEIMLVVLILAVEAVLFRRYWCKFLCPVGATLSLFRTKTTLHVHHNAAQCDCPTGLEPCRFACPLNLSPRRLHLYPNCFNCGVCVAMCEKIGKRALTLEFGGPPKDAHAPEVRGPVLKLTQTR
jgi:ferredoxin-type protein NapH